MATRAVAVAFSGGRDSTALLHATVRQAHDSDVHVIALHVHHGLHPQADAWLDHCRRQCARWSKRGLPVTFEAHRLTSAPAGGESVEAWAREARYAALTRMAASHRCRVVMLAQHRRDQAETFLLQALRGAGVAGLSGMPRRAERDGIVWLRPWLDRPREQIEAYVRRHRLSHIDDTSNDDPRFARNCLRLQVWPTLRDAFADAEAALAASATWAQQADAALDELASLDLARIASAEGLSIVAWRELSIARRSNALRAWLRPLAANGARATLVARLLDELGRRPSARWPFGDGELRSYRGRLVHAPGASRKPRSAPRESRLVIEREGRHPLPGWGGALEVERVASGGVPLAWLAHVDLRERVGGEKFQTASGRPARSLKKQFQAAALPAWNRAGPIVYSGGQLVFVPGLGIDARVVGLPGQALVSLRWSAQDAPSS